MLPPFMFKCARRAGEGEGAVRLTVGRKASPEGGRVAQS